MVETVNTSNSGVCTLWTPWGPQYTQPATSKLASLRRALGKMNSKKQQRSRKAVDAALAKPECAYEP